VVFFCVAIGRDPTGLTLAVVNDEADLFNGTSPERNGSSAVW
jgi:hypothetical protein